MSIRNTSKAGGIGSYVIMVEKVVNGSYELKGEVKEIEEKVYNSVENAESIYIEVLENGEHVKLENADVDTIEGLKVKSASVVLTFDGEEVAIDENQGGGGGGGATTYKHQVMLEAFLGDQVLGMIMTVETDFEEGLTKENIATKLTDYFLRRYPDLPYKTASQDSETTTMVAIPIDAIALRTFNPEYHFIEKEDGIIYPNNFFPMSGSDVQINRLVNVVFIVADEEGEKFVGLSAAVLGTDSEGGVLVRDSFALPLGMLSEALTYCVDVVEGTHSNVDPIC